MGRLNQVLGPSPREGMGVQVVELMLHLPQHVTQLASVHSTARVGW